MEMSRTTGIAVLISAATTIIGFSVLIMPNIVSIIPIRSVGMTLVAGIMATLVFSMILVPVLIWLLRFNKRTNPPIWGSISRVPVKNYIVILLIASAITFAGLSNLDQLDKPITGLTKPQITYLQWRQWLSILIRSQVGKHRYSYLMHQSILTIKKRRLDLLMYWMQWMRWKRIKQVPHKYNQYYHIRRSSTSNTFRAHYGLHSMMAVYGDFCMKNAGSLTVLNVLHGSYLTPHHLQTVKVESTCVRIW